MITQAELTRHVRLIDYYKIESSHKGFLNTLLEHNVNSWYEFWNNMINFEIKDRINKKIEKYKRFCKKPNKTQYLTAYKKLW